jgi:hypothetical protein
LLFLPGDEELFFPLPLLPLAVDVDVAGAAIPSMTTSLSPPSLSCDERGLSLDDRPAVS